MAAFVLTYSLAPAAAYPTQLTQAVEALRYVLNTTGRKPSQVLIGGDSAGGNLVMGVLSHLAHGHPAIPKLEISEPLAGAVGIAPWTLIGEDHSGREIYSGGDLITPAVDMPWSTAFLGGSAKDNFTSASAAPQSWFAAFPVSRVLILGGGSEILLPAIEDLAEKLKVRLDHESANHLFRHP
jgi:acetyl esterase/lipase